MSVRMLLASVTAIALAAASPVAMRQSTMPREAPESTFRSLFNGRDLAGWHGRGHVDPRSIWALDEAGRARAREQRLPEFRKHWRVERGAGN